MKKNTPTFDFSKFPQFVAGVRKSCRFGMRNLGESFIEDVRDNFPKRGKYAPSSPGEPPARKKNNLSNSITAAVIDDVRVAVYPAIKYGPAHEFGKTITPTTSKFLRIPVNESAKRLSESEGTKSLRNIGVFRIFKSKAGNLIAAGAEKVRTQRYETGADGKRKTIVNWNQPVFVLKPFVELPARPFMRPALKRAKGNEEHLNAFIDGINVGLSSVFGKVKVRKA
jgi:hypothetical protein